MINDRALAYFYVYDKLSDLKEESISRNLIDIDMNKLNEKIVNNMLRIQSNEFTFDLEVGNILIDKIQVYSQCLKIIDTIQTNLSLKLREYVLNFDYFQRSMIFHNYLFKFDRINSMHGKTFKIPFCTDSHAGLIPCVVFNIKDETTMSCEKLLYSVFRDELMNIEFFITSKNRRTFAIEVYPINYDFTTDNLGYPIGYVNRVNFIINNDIFISEKKNLDMLNEAIGKFSEEGE